MFIRAFIRFFTQSIYLTRLFYLAGLSAVALFVLSYFIPQLFEVAGLLLIVLLLTSITDILLLFGRRYAMRAERLTAPRWSNGDDNLVTLHFENNYGFSVEAEVVDEIPEQFQVRDWKRRADIAPGGEAVIEYHLRPTARGEYVFGNINVFVTGRLRLACRRFVFPAAETIKVYPSFLQMRRYHLLAVSNRLQEAGVKRVRRLGHSLEFEQIKEYVPGDDYRTINWKATARKKDLMVNTYTDERSQQIYCLINKGRSMKMPFEGMTLLDYAINAAVVLCNVALIRQDKAGLITFAQTLDIFLQADKKSTQMSQVLETLYREQTAYLEPDFEKVYSIVRSRITHRSLLVLFTNFESMDSLLRELPSLRLMARYHLLLVVFFENTELRKLTEAKAASLEGIYVKTIAEKFAFEKRLMLKELRNNGILSILTTPRQLTVDTVNKYLELKNKLSI